MATTDETINWSYFLMMMIINCNNLLQPLSVVYDKNNNRNASIISSLSVQIALPIKRWLIIISSRSGLETESAL